MKRFHVVGIGNAIVDAIASVDDGFLYDIEVAKGVMQLVDQNRGETLYSVMPDPSRAPGGSVANTLAGLSRLGLETAFIGRVADDDLGRFYMDAMAEAGTDFVNSPIAESALSTSRSMIFVSPDGERSMNTYLGISTEFEQEDVRAEIAGQTDILFLEGYLYDKPKGKAAFEAAARMCHAGGGRAGLSLSDPFCVDRHRDDFRRLIPTLNFVIGNEHEWASLYQTDLETALEKASAETTLAVCTCGGRRVIILSEGARIEVPVQHVLPVDTTGAGDLFAAGFIYGLATGRPLDVAGQMGCVAAAEIISHVGARPEADLPTLLRNAGLL